ncbi:MAG: 3-isopropylmalate dehydrogenase [Parvularcula sp.]|jgi:3-isopropylmalate dehydrogenase|nr:3-isopropylmalate dehydrogenase [Parvularcula sp.]
MTLHIVSLGGDGIGPEVTRAAFRALSVTADAFGFNLAVSHHLIGGAAIDKTGDPLPDETLSACRDADAVFLGAVGGPKWSGSVRPEAGLLKLRAELELFANLRPVSVAEGLEDLSPLKRPEGFDIIVVRELTGGLYFGEKEEGDPASDLCRYSREEILRLARIGFELARDRKRTLTSVDKANVLASSRLWRRTVDELAPEYPEVSVEHVLVDAMTMHLLSRPAAYDVIITENLFGDILSDEAAAIAGSLGLAASASLGSPGRPGLFEPVHGSAPDIVGRGIANPLGAILSAALLLRHAGGQPQAAETIEAAVGEVLRSGITTPDLGGKASTDEVTEAVLARLRP